MVRALCRPSVVAFVVVRALGTLARAQDAEPDHIRGEITSVQASSVDVKVGAGKTVRLELPKDLTVISLAKGRFTDVDFGTYVGAVAVRLDEYSPILRDSAGFFHRGFELRIIDEQLRGIALGEKKWDLTPESIITHGWVDDIEIRVLSVKWGPTDYDETDVEIPRDAPVQRMSLGNKSLIQAGGHGFAGAQTVASGKHVPPSAFVWPGGSVASV